MYSSKAIMPFVAIGLVCAAFVVAVLPAAAQGSRDDMFRRHFWRGQAYHGAGYPAQVHEMGRTPPSQDLRASNIDALVE